MSGIVKGFFKLCLCLMIFFSAILLALSAFSIWGYRKLYDGDFAYSRELLTVILSAVSLVLFFQWIYKKLKNTGEKCSLILFFTIVAAQLLFLVLVSHPMVISDAARVQNEALSMVRWNHQKLNLKYNYFQQYTNNHFITVLFYYYYKLLSLLGISSVWVPTILLNVFCIDVGIYITYRTARRLRGRGCANLTLVFFLLCPTTYVWLTMAYTNTFSFPFVMAILYLCLWLRGGEPNRKNVLKCTLLGFVTVTGYFVRPTTILPIIAMFLFSAVKFFAEPLVIQRREQRIWNPEWNLMGKVSEKRNTMIKAGIVLLVCALTWCGCQLLLAQHVDREKLTGQFPVAHWIMMGLNERTGGGFAGEDVEYTKSFEGLEAKKKADWKRFRQRVREMGPAGLARQMTVKMARVWAMGDDDSLQKSSYARDYPVLYERFMGENNGWFIVYMQAFRMASFLMIFLSVLWQMRRGECREIFLYTLTFLGAILFFLIWEANMKYNICFMGLYLLLMMDGTRILRHKICVWGVGKKGVRKHAVLCLGALCLALSFLLQLPMLKAEAKVQKTQYYSSRIQADSEPIDGSIQDPPALLEQTIEEGQFRWRDEWNCLGIFFEKREEQGLEKEYLVELISEADGQVIYREMIGVGDLGRRSAFWVKLSRRKLLSSAGFRLRLTHRGGSYGMVPKVCCFPALNPYPYGCLYVNGRKTGYDLAMSMYKQRRR